jgi:hypothetical protein
MAPRRAICKTGVDSEREGRLGMISVEHDLRRQLKEAHMSRAMVYGAFYEALVERFGADLAEEVMKKAIYRRGR